MFVAGMEEMEQLTLDRGGRCGEGRDPAHCSQGQELEEDEQADGSGSHPVPVILEEDVSGGARRLRSGWPL